MPRKEFHLGGDLTYSLKEFHSSHASYLQRQKKVTEGLVQCGAVVYPGVSPLVSKSYICFPAVVPSTSVTPSMFLSAMGWGKEVEVL